ncbi:MAG: glutamyl-tRNA reductase [Bacteroidota bacterium]|nr:glutamyl-tRNA reductase [Bacteroidota bacterium]
MTGVVGISYQSAPVAVREKLAFSVEQGVAFMNSLRNEFSLPGTVLLSTCNRTELYFFSEADNEQLLLDIQSYLIKYKKVSSDGIDKSFFRLSGDDCVQHLFRVTSGLDSMIMGEYQILGQVKDSFRVSSENNLLSPVLSRMFHKAFEVGKAARNLYRISTVTLSAGEAAVKMVKNTFNNIAAEKILVVGAGQTARTVVESLEKEQCPDITVVNRDIEKARLLSYQYQTAVADFTELPLEVAKSSVVFVTTAAVNPVLTVENMAEAMNQRKAPIVLFDLSVPRNVEPEVAAIEDVSLYAIDDLSLSENSSQVMNEDMLDIEELIETALQEFNDWLTTLNLVPTIELLKERFNEVLSRRLTFVENKMSPEEFQAVSQNGKFLTDKFLQMIIHSLRETSGNGRHTSYIDMMNNMLKPLNSDQE